MKRPYAWFLALALLAAGCSGDDAAAPDSTDAAAVTTTQTTDRTTSPSTTTTSTVVETTTTTTAPPAGDRTTTTGGTSEAPPVFACPDLFGQDADPERSDGILEAWALPGLEAMWQIPLGARTPAWAVWSDEVILGFADGELVGLDIATCEVAWTITVQSGIQDLVVTEQGLILTVNGGTIAAFSGQGFGAWRHQAIDSVYTFVGENNGIHVFVDQFGDLIGFDTGGDVVFQWGGASDPLAVAVSESYVYRATGAEIAARPVAGGDVVWATEIPGVSALFAVPGLLIARDDAELHAINPQDGARLWSLAFDGEIAGPMVLDHGEIHIAASEDAIGVDTVWHLDPADGTTVFRATAPAGTEWFPEMDDALVLEIGDDGTVTAVNLRQRSVWTIETGANRIDRFTHADVGRTGVIVTLTYSAERF